MSFLALVLVAAVRAEQPGHGCCRQGVGVGENSAFDSMRSEVSLEAMGDRLHSKTEWNEAEEKLQTNPSMTEESTERERSLPLEPVVHSKAVPLELMFSNRRRKADEALAKHNVVDRNGVLELPLEINTLDKL